MLADQLDSSHVEKEFVFMIDVALNLSPHCHKETELHTRLALGEACPGARAKLLYPSTLC